MLSKNVPASRSTESFSLAASFSVPSDPLDLGSRPGPPRLTRSDAPFIVLRTFFRNTAGGSAEAKTATLDIIGWREGSPKGLLLSSILLTAGSNSSLNNPVRLASVGDGYTWYESDQMSYVSGLARPDVRAYSNGCALIFIDTFDCNQFQFRCASIASSSELIVGVAGAASIPPAVQVPFEASAAVVADVFADQDFGLSAPGSGQEYVIRQLDATLDAAKAVTLHTGANNTNPVWGSHTLAQGFSSKVFDPPIHVGENLKPLCTIASFTGRITIRGVKRSVGLPD